MRLEAIAGREGFKSARIQLTWTDRVVDHLVNAGFDSRYGARPLQRVLETQVVTPLARYLVEHPGISQAVLLIDTNEDGIVIRHPE